MVVTQKDPFLAAVLKAKYFPHSSFWKTNFVGPKSVLWSSILQVSVRKVVPTITSNERWDQPLDGSVLATNDTGFILGPAGAVRPAVVCSRHYIALHRGARRGGLQARRERRPGLQVPEVLIEASANNVVEVRCVRVCRALSFIVSVLSSVAEGSPFLL
jgi:hypothetical protein